MVFSVTLVLAGLALLLWRMKGVSLAGICLGVMIGVAGSNSVIGEAARWAITTGQDAATALNGRFGG